MPLNSQAIKIRAIGHESYAHNLALSARWPTLRFRYIYTVVRALNGLDGAPSIISFR